MGAVMYLNLSVSRALVDFNGSMRRMTTITGSISLAALAITLLPGVAFAKTDGNSDDIVVTARRAATARDEQQAAPNLVNVQSAETIAKYPDVNSAEALSRMPGVSLSIDTAEGRYVNIRGLDGNFNGATFGGVVLLNTSPSYTYFNAAGRAVEFDTVPIGAVDRMSVTKTGLPDHEAEGIGGSVELSPRTAIGASRLFAQVTLGGGLETDRNTGLYRDEVVIGGPLGGAGANGTAPFSFVVSQFLYNDKRSFDDLEAAYKDDQPATPDKAFDALELRRYAYNRKRFGFSGEFDFTPDTDTRIYVRGNLTGYNERVLRNRLNINGLGDTVTVDPANANGFVATGASTEKTLRDSDVKEQNLVLQLGGDHHFGDVHVEWFGAYSRATYTKYTDYNATFAGPANLTVAYDNITNPNYPTFRVLSGASITDPANYALDSIKNSTESSRDREWSYALSAGMPLHLAADDEIKLGGKLRYREKVSMPFGNGKFSPTGAPILWSSATSGSPVTDFYNTGTAIGPNIDPARMSALFDASGASLPLNTGSYFDDTENIAAAFIQYHATLGKLGVLGGVRYEHTSAVYRGIGDSIVGGAVVNGPLSTPHRYDNLFPTLQLRYQAMPNLVARATYSTGIARPGFYQTLQATSIDVGGGVVSTGNPDLKPMYGHNFDLSLEYYLPGSGIISLGAFDKEIRNYIVTRAVRGNYPGITGIALIQTYENVSGAHARGLEANFVDKFTGLPGLLGGLGVDANLTYVASSLALRDGQGNVAMPGTIPWSWNAALFYERGPVQLRLSSQFESSVLFGVGGNRASDIFQDSRFTMDFTGSYKLSRNIEFYVNAKNLTNAALRFYEGSPNRPIQREFYDMTLEGGVKLSF
jgi:TonB-dependent receptor